MNHFWWSDGRMSEWLDGWMETKAGLRDCYAQSKSTIVMLNNFNVKVDLCPTTVNQTTFLVPSNAMK